MTAVSTPVLILDPELVTKTLISIASTVEKFTVFSENQNTLNSSLSEKLQCIFHLVEIVKSLQIKTDSLAFENQRLSTEIDMLKSCNAKQAPTRNNVSLDNFKHLPVNEIPQCEPSRRTQLIISGIPDSVSDSPHIIAKRVFTSLGTPQTTEEIVSARRITEKRSSASFHSHFTAARCSIKPYMSRALIVQLKTSSALDQVINKKRAKRALSSREVFNINSDDLLYVNEFLPPNKYELLRQTRSKAKTVNCKYVWLNHGRIAARYTETHPVISIKSLDDLAKL